MEYKHRISPKFIEHVSKKCVKLTCEVIECNDATLYSKLKELAGTINGVFFGEYYSVSRLFYIYVYQPNLTKKIKYYKNPHLLSMVKNSGLQNGEEKTLLDYALKKLEKDISIKIIQIENIDWNNANPKLKEKLILSALKNKSIIQQLIEQSPIKINEKLTLYAQYYLTVTSDENENYYLIIKPHSVIVKNQTIYELLKTQKDLDLHHSLITTSLDCKKKKPVKVSKIISPDDPEYYRHVENINAYYQKQGIDFKVGGDEKECLIFITDDGYSYHSKNSQLCNVINNDKIPLNNKSLQKTLTILRNGIIVEG